MNDLLHVGVVGAGAMGSDHVRTLTRHVPGARVAQVFDMDRDRAAAVAGAVGARVTETADELIGSPDVDAVVIASPDFTHRDLALACLDVTKPALCEKPLAVSAADARVVVEAELELGRRLLQVGFMRRYDPGFNDLRRTVRGGGLGTVRAVHAVHRNVSSTTSTDDLSLVTGSMVHELDTIPWLLGDQISAIRVESPVRQGFRDPQLATLWTSGGVMATVEVFVNASYGYDVRCEVVGTQGVASLSPTPTVTTRLAGAESGRVPSDFVAHYADAYRLELEEWVSAARDGTVRGPSAWDGLLANLAAQAGVASLSSGGIEPVESGRRPALYDEVAA